MIQEATGDRRRALEDAFFAHDNGGSPHGAHAAVGHDMRPQALSAASGITDPALLARLVAAGIDGDTLTCLSLAPLVAVAWADGALDAKERAALLTAAAESGIERQGPAFRLLEDWLAHPPPPQLIEAWSHYVRDRGAAMEPGAVQALRLHLLGRARRVAEAAGELLGHARPVSPAEEAMLERLERAFAT
ncbi:hypothetical protein J8J14_12980 [Roseomonas sp. SSH11]|uniref:TerB family tellurite resistance protein n=1 Tax=Pararoseomonas baculiformis TaxID=2820812 RepID=A0ABS4AF68_9PROT|nr:hypothetical protein [Pararoseomonas baculiformis]MBP0445687.1 hypothetical protein [Pararoseomonas baculiformis]